MLEGSGFVQVSHETTTPLRKGEDMILAIGLRGQAETQVTADKTAHALGSGDLEVLGTPALVALMERAAVNAVADCLQPTETTVGTAIEIAHVAATPAGLPVHAEARLTAIEGRTLTFLIEAHDSREKIGQAHHRRVIVTRDRFMAKARQKA